MCVCVLCQCICVCRYLYLHLYLYLHTHRICCRCSLLLCMFFLCPERQQGLPNASSSRAIIIDTPQVVSSCKPPSLPFPFSLLSLLLSLYLSPFSARLFTFVIVAVVLNLASYCLAVSVAVAVPVRVPSTPFSSHRIYSVFVHKRRPQKEPKTMGDKGHSGRELLLCLWRGSNGDGVRPEAGEGGSARDAVVMLPSHCLAGFTQIPAGSGSNSGSSSINHRRATAWRGRSCLSQCPIPVRDQSECQFQYIAHVFLFSFYLRSDTL